MHQIPLKRLLSLLLVSLSMAGHAQESAGVSAAAAVAAPAALPGQLVVAPATGAQQAPAAGTAQTQTQTQADSASNASGTTDAEAGNTPAPAEPASSLRKARAPSQFQQFVLEATGRQLPFYGHDLFDDVDCGAGDLSVSGCEQ